MYLVALGWIYVALMAALVEATSSQGTVLGAFFTLLLYGLLPVAIVLYVLGSPARRRARRRAADSAQGDGRNHSTTDPLAPEGKKP